MSHVSLKATSRIEIVPMESVSLCLYSDVVTRVIRI